MNSPRTFWNRAVAVTAASAVAVAIAVPPATAHAVSTRPSLVEHTYELSASESIASLNVALPTSIEQLAAAIIPSFGTPVPSPPPSGPVVAPTDINSAIKNVYNAVEPWVRYGFELATYAVGWVPYVGWLSGQIMIFYNFGERIVRSIVSNVDDWLFGSLPFVQGLANVAQDSWNALVQLGIDQWNFWLPPLPPLPPLPFAAGTAVAAEDGAALRLLSSTPEDTDGTTDAADEGTEEAADPAAQPSIDADASPALPDVPAVTEGETPPAEASDDATDVVDDQTEVVTDEPDVVTDEPDVVEDEPEAGTDEPEVVDDTAVVEDDSEVVKDDKTTDDPAQQDPDPEVKGPGDAGALSRTVDAVNDQHPDADRDSASSPTT